MILKYLAANILVFFLIACSVNLPQKKQEISSYVPSDQKAEVETKTILNNPDFSFVSKNFPKNCDWQKYIRTVDGDTIVVTKNTKVRFIGIDTPETKHPRKKIQPYGLESSAYTKKLLQDTIKVCLISDSLGDKYDKYGRRLAYIFTENGDDINAELLKAGLARGYFYFPFNRKKEFKFYENQAKIKKLKIWSKNK